MKHPVWLMLLKVHVEDISGNQDLKENPCSGGSETGMSGIHQPGLTATPAAALPLLPLGIVSYKGD